MPRHAVGAVYTSESRAMQASALKSVLVSNSVDGWDFDEFRATVLVYANAVGLKAIPAIASAADIDPSMLSKYFRGKGKPTHATLEKLADAIGANYLELVFLAGLPGGTKPAERAVKLPVAPIIAELTLMLGPRSPLSEQSRKDLERDLDRAADYFRKEMRSRRKLA
jgi:transcriptional regulator with XRE-family HTH domain